MPCVTGLFEPRDYRRCVCGQVLCVAQRDDLISNCREGFTVIVDYLLRAQERVGTEA